jgi:hypothetical protein
MWTAGSEPAVVPSSPSDLNGPAIGFYLYHVLQKKLYDNFTIPTPEQHVKHLPMALCLYYQLTAISGTEDANGTYNEQLMMSVAMKAIHDCPIIDDSTKVLFATPNVFTPILDAAIQGNNNKFCIVQQPVPHSDAVHNWTAGNLPMRLSAYYEVSTAFLEPEETKSYSGRVLQYGNYIFLKGAPRITGNQNTISFRLPGEVTNREIQIQPAQAPPSENPPAPVLNDSIISFYGAGLAGDSTKLRILHSRFKDTVIASPLWNISPIGDTAVNITVRENAVEEKTATPVVILPGLYAAQLVVDKTLQLANGLSKTFVHTSNQFPFTVSPRIDNISALNVSTVTVTGYLFQHFEGPVDVLKESIEVYVGTDRIVRKDGAAIIQGEFKVTGTTTMDINILGPLTPGREIPIRIIINGAESKPQWIVI